MPINNVKEVKLKGRTNGNSTRVYGYRAGGKRYEL